MGKIIAFSIPGKDDFRNTAHANREFPRSETAHKGCEKHSDPAAQGFFLRHPQRTTALRTSGAPPQGRQARSTTKLASTAHPVAYGQKQRYAATQQERGNAPPAPRCGRAARQSRTTARGHLRRRPPGRPGHGAANPEGKPSLHFTGLPRDCIALAPRSMGWDAPRGGNEAETRRPRPACCLPGQGPKTRKAPGGTGRPAAAPPGQGPRHEKLRASPRARPLRHRTPGQGPQTRKGPRRCCRSPNHLDGAEGESRTPTGKPPLDPEPSVSTNSTTSASGRPLINPSFEPLQAFFKIFLKSIISAC